jgi:hypothetical protein
MAPPNWEGITVTMISAIAATAITKVVAQPMRSVLEVRRLPTSGICATRRA